MEPALPAAVIAAAAALVDRDGHRRPARAPRHRHTRAHGCRAPPRPACGSPGRRARRDRPPERAGAARLAVAPQRLRAGGAQARRGRREGDRDRHRLLGRARGGGGRGVLPRGRRFRTRRARGLPPAPAAPGRRRDRSRESADPRARGEGRRHRQRADAGRTRRRGSLRAAREPDRGARDPDARREVARRRAGRAAASRCRAASDRLAAREPGAPGDSDRRRDRRPLRPRADRGPRGDARRHRRRVPGSVVDAARSRPPGCLDPGDRLPHAGGGARRAPGARCARPRAAHRPRRSWCRRWQRRSCASRTLVAAQRSPHSRRAWLALSLTLCWWLCGLLLEPVVPLAQLAAHYVLGLEGVRRRFQRRLDDRERSLSTLFSVGEATATPASTDMLGVALSLLGDVVAANGVALLRSRPRASSTGGAWIGEAPPAP